MHHGADVMRQRDMDWNAWMVCSWNGLAPPQITPNLRAIGP